MTDTKILERRDAPFGMTLREWPGRRWLDDLFRDSAFSPMFRVEEVREGDTLIVRAELPGVDPAKDIAVEVVEGALVVSADRTERHEERGEHLHRSEFRYGSLTRSVPLPKGVDPKSISAVYVDGVLEVRLTLPATESVPSSYKVEVTRA